MIAPTFITGYPAEVSPLSRRQDNDPDFTDRFELFAAGRELANGFSELNDPEDQATRFLDQVEAGRAGDKEAMSFKKLLKSLVNPNPKWTGWIAYKNKKSVSH